MSPKFLRSLLLSGFVAALSSCDVFKKDSPPPANDPYTAANPYATGTGTAPPPANPGYPAANAYGAPGAYDPGAAAGAGYTAPNYNQPYVQPSTPPTGAGYAGAYEPGTAPAAGGSGRTHKVAPRENLTVIGRRYGVSVGALMKANNLQDDRIVVGKTLIIP